MDAVFVGLLQVMSTASSWCVRTAVVDFARELGHSVVLKRELMDRSKRFIQEVRTVLSMLDAASSPAYVHVSSVHLRTSRFSGSKPVNLKALCACRFEAFILQTMRLLASSR